MAKHVPPFRLGIATQAVSNGFALKPRGEDSEDNRLDYRPASSNYFGLTGGYKWIGGTLYFSVPAKDEVIAREGTSRYKDYRLSLYFRNWGLELGYNRFVGYLISSSDKLTQTTLNGEEFHKIPDLDSVGYGANFIWVMDPDDYSLPAGNDWSEIQEKSGGSWFLIASWRKQFIQSTASIIPSEKQILFGADSTFRAASASNYAIGGGYAHLWPMGAFFIAPFLGASAGLQSISYEVNGAEKSRTAGAINIHLRLALGVNVSSFFFVIHSNVDRFEQATESVSVSNSVLAATFALGARF